MQHPCDATRRERDNNSKCLTSSAEAGGARGGVSGRRTWRGARGSAGLAQVWGVRGCRRRPARCVVRRLVELALNCGGGVLEDGSTMRR